MANDAAVASDGAESFDGRLWVGDDGLVAAVTRGEAAGPPELTDAPAIDVGDSLVFPGLIDLHNHLAYNTLPLWSVPDRPQPFPHHDSWPNAKTYAPEVTWPAYAFITAAPEELLAYVETKAIVGGTTSIQGSPPKNRPADGWLVRNVEDERFGTRRSDFVYASTLTLDPATLGQRATQMRTNSSLFIYHCSEGRRGSLVAREFRSAGQAGCLQDHFVAIHCNAVGAEAFSAWQDAGAVVWSPLSNLWLYGETTDIPAAREAGLTLCLGSDWTPSGSRNVLGELKTARVTADARGWDLSDLDLVRMVTCNPGDVLARGWPRRVGRLQPGAIADVTVVRASEGADPFRTLVGARERDIELVVIDGQRRYGKPTLMRGAGPTGTGTTGTGTGTGNGAGAGAPTRTPTPTPTTIEVDGQARSLDLRRFDDASATLAWEEVTARLEAVRADPKGEIEAARSRQARAPGGFDSPDAPLRLALDMPTGIAPVGGLPKDLGVIEIPPLDPLGGDGEWARSLQGRGYHGGVLDRLAEFYA